MRALWAGMRDIAVDRNDTVGTDEERRSLVDLTPVLTFADGARQVGRAARFFPSIDALRCQA